MSQLTGRAAFGERLRRERRKLAEREDRDIENQDVAKALGVDAATVGRWFLGKAMPRDDATMTALADYFGVTPAWLRYAQEPREASARLAMPVDPQRVAPAESLPGVTPKKRSGAGKTK